MVQCVAGCCSVLVRGIDLFEETVSLPIVSVGGAGCCSVLQGVAGCCSVLCCIVGLI